MKRKNIGLMTALLAAAAAGQMGGGNPIPFEAPQVPILNPIVTTQVNPTEFGLYRASKRTHKRYLRAHRLGKFKKGKR